MNIDNQISTSIIGINIKESNKLVTDNFSDAENEKDRNNE